MVTAGNEGHQKVSSSISGENEIKGQGQEEINVTKPFPPIPSENIKELGHRNARFAFDLLEYLTEQSRDAKPENLMFSPFSISMLLSLINLGSAGDTKSELVRGLHYQGFEDLIDQAYQELFQKFFSNPEVNTGALRVANGIFSSNNFKINPQFEKDIHTFFQGNISELDFSQNPRESESFISEWIENATNGKILDAMPEGSIDGTTQLILANAIYLKTKWQQEFLGYMANQTFHLSESETILVDMMAHDSEPLRYANVDDLGFHIVEVDLRGRHAAMYFIVPYQVSGLDDVIASIEADMINDIIENKMETVRTELRMPKFRFTNDIPLSSILQDLGIKHIFSSSANLSKMLQDDLENDLDPECTDEPVDQQNENQDKKCSSGEQEKSVLHRYLGYYVNNIKHSTFIAVDEYGVEAAAASIGDIVLGGPDFVPPEVTLVLDRPFSFFIRGNITKSLLFMGSVYNPLKS